MDRDQLLRRVLRVSVVFNLAGALMFLFPASLGQLAGMPTPVPTIYSAALAYLVALFAGTYAWMARQPRINRPLVAFAACGKGGFFVVVLLCWLAGAASGLALLAATGDLAFAAIFTWWLVGDAPALANELVAAAAPREGRST